MKEARLLARLVAARRQPGAPLLDFEAGDKTKEGRLLAALLAAKEPTRAQLVRALYEPAAGGAAGGKSENAFRQLHARVLGKLLNHVYFLDHADPRHLVSRRYELECLDLLHKGTILRLEGYLALAVRLCKQCLALAERDGFTAYAVLAAQELRLLYAFTHQQKPYQAACHTLARLQHRRQLEEEAQAVYYEFYLSFTGNVASRHNVARSLMRDQRERLRQLHQQAQSPTTAELLYKIEMHYLELSEDYAGIIAFSLEAERQLAQGHYNPCRFDVRFNLFVRALAYQRAYQPEEGLAVAAAAEQHFHPSSGNWLVLQGTHVELALQAGRYELARRLVQAAYANPVFARQRDLAQQRWDLLAAYLDFVSPLPHPSAARRRQLGRLALSLPDYSRDKRGLNVAILVAQVLHFVREHDAEAAGLRIERLGKYRLRHLRVPGYRRTRLFLRLLQLLADEQFDPARCERLAEPYLDQLAAIPFAEESFSEVETVPYPALWALLLERLRAAPMTFAPVTGTRTAVAKQGGARGRVVAVT